MNLTEREREQVSDLDKAIDDLAVALEGEDRAEVARLARAVEIEAYALRLMLRGGRR